MRFFKKDGLPKNIGSYHSRNRKRDGACFRTDDERGEKITSYSQHTFSDLSIIDSLLTLGLPPKITAETDLDVFSHSLEVFLGLQSTFLSDLLSLKEIELISKI